nr:hypothetical protein [Tanacetum cinerariifolium]
MLVHIIVKNTRTMDMTIDQEVALDEALVPHASRLRIGKSNFRLRSDITSKESTLQLATAMVHHHSICFKMDNKKHIVNLEYFKEIMHICPRLPGQTFDDLLFEEEILEFLRFLRHNGEIRKLTDKNVDFAYLLWEEFVYQVEHKDAKKSNEMYYPRFTKVIIHYYMTKNPSIPRRNKKSSDKDDDDDVDEGSDDQDGDDDKDDDDQDEKDDDDDQDEVNDDDQDTDKDGEEFIHPKLSIHDEEETKDEERFDPIAKTHENSDDEGNDDENLGLNIGSEEGQDAEDDENELYRDVNINLEGRVVQMADVHTTQEFEDTHVTLTPVNPDGQQQTMTEAPTTVALLTLSAPTLTPSTIATISIVPQSPTSLTTSPSTLLQDLPNFGSLFGFDHRLKTLEANFLEFSDRLQDEAQVENEEFLKNLNENIQKIIKEQVKEQVKVQVSNILPKIKKTVNEQLEAEVLTRSSNSSNTSYAVVADLLEMELKKTLIEKMKGNKSIHRSDEQRNLYKALVEAYESDKIILDTYGDIVMLKRCRDDDVEKDEEPSAGSDRGTTGKSTQGSKSQQKTVNESVPVEKPMQTTHDLEEPSHQEFKTGAADDQPIEASQHPEWFQQQKKPPTPDHTLTLELLAGPTYELMKGSCKSLVELEFFLEEVYKATTDQLDWNNPKGQQYPHNLLKPLPLIPNSRGRHVIPFDHFINNDLEYLCGGASSRKYITFVTKIKATDYGHIKWIEDLVPRIMESTRDVYSKRRIIAVTELKIVEWHNYKHLDGITVHRDDEKLYKFKEGDFKRLRVQYIKDMSLLVVQGKLTNLTVEERFAFNVSLRMFTRSIVIQRRVEDLQLGVESYQKKLNLTKSDTDGTLNDVRTALDDHLKDIQMKYLPQTIWSKSNKERAVAMIHAIDKQLKTRRIMRSLEKFVGRRLYGGDFRMLQRTI